MKKWLISSLIAAVLLTGCSSRNQMDQALKLRASLVSGNGYSFDSEITADYGDKVYSFRMHCKADQAGNVSFEVTAPDSIAGITGTVSEEGGRLTFDETALVFNLLADGQVTPVSAPWILVHTLHYGYITSCAKTDNGILMEIDDRYEEDALNLLVRLNSENLPAYGEILWQGRRILSLNVTNFSYL